MLMLQSITDHKKTSLINVYALAYYFMKEPLIKTIKNISEVISHDWGTNFFYILVFLFLIFCIFVHCCL